MIKDIRITLSRIVTFYMLNNRLAAVDLGPSAAFVGAVGTGLEEGTLVVFVGICRGVDGEECFYLTRLFTEGVQLIHTGGTGPNGMQRIAFA